jgi:polyphosphate kinase
MTGYARPAPMGAPDFTQLTTCDALPEQIDREIEFARSGKPATIWLGMNSLVDKTLIDVLYRASCAGVQVSAVVRAICCLRPGGPGAFREISASSPSSVAS